MLTIIGFSASRAGSGMALTPASPGSANEKVASPDPSVTLVQSCGLANWINVPGSGLDVAAGATAGAAAWAGFSFGTL